MKITLDITELKARFKPQTHNSVNFGQHGSRAGDRDEDIYYLNPYTGNWSAYEDAFRGYVHQQLDNELREILNHK